MTIWIAFRWAFTLQIAWFLLHALWRDSQGKSAAIDLVFACGTLFLYVLISHK